MSEEKQDIDPALLDDANPAGLNPNDAVNGGMNLKQRPRGIRKINKKGIFVAAGIIGTAAIVATTTFNGTGSAVSGAAKDAVATQAPARPSEVKRDTLWYADKPDKVAAADPNQVALDGQGVPGAGAPAGGQTYPAAAATNPGGTKVPDLTGKAVTPFGAATAARTGAGTYTPGAAGGAGNPGQNQAEQQAAQQAAQAVAQQAAQTKQKQEQDVAQAMKSNLAAGGFGDKQGGVATSPVAGNVLPAALPPASSLAAAGTAQQRDDDQNKQERKDQFLKGQREQVDPAYSSSRKTAARSLFEVKAGGIIPAVLISGINSDLPGQVIGQVSEDVRDTRTGGKVLIPQGTKLIGLYDAHVAYGQQRILLAWNRMIFSDGSSFDLKGMPGADMGGFAGFFDEVDNHYAKIFGSSALLSLISAGVQLSQPNTGGNSNNNQPSVSQTVSGALGQQIGQTGMTLTQKNLNIQPTLVIRPGYKFNIMVTADMILTPSAK